ncbi:uncharacterized protein LOC144341567 isoform X2 [Saccoglossus kowalevskii]|uniref:Myb-like protein X-like isoform X1 n=1 Tax=Saccoglossus kowalevskii TaxID=10224 RepID=A0ABM0GLP8_SACKO|nr:PREDICTED: myb-like protein X-like isoform X1 [Saccoglossus kowalevskii]
MACGKRVYEMEKMVADKFLFHKSCFRCKECRTVLRPGNYTAIEDKVYCKPHFTQLFKLKGNYSEGFDLEKKKRPSIPTDMADQQGSANGEEEQEQLVPDLTQDEYEKEDPDSLYVGIKSIKGKFETAGSFDELKEPCVTIEPEIMSREPEVVENEPEVRVDLAREESAKEEPRELYGGMKSIRGMFESGEVKKTKKVDNVKVENLADSWQEAEVQVVENEPEVRDDVVRASDRPEDTEVLTFAGLKSIKDRFEKKEERSNVPPKVIDIYSGQEPRHDTDSSDEAEMEEEEEKNKEAEILASLNAKSMKQRWERGDVSRVEVKKTATVSLPAKLDDYEVNADAGMVENNPIRRDDVVRESDTSKQIFSTNTKKLRSMWETGNISNPKQPIKKQLDIDIRSLREQEDAGAHVVENEPEIRTDVVREEEEKIVFSSARLLRDRWEKGDVVKATKIHKQVIDIPVREDTDADDSVVENNPVQRDDVVRSTDVMEEGVLTTFASSLRNKWEKGEFENVSVIKKEKIEIPRHAFEDVLEEGVVEGGQTTENEPELRLDLARESDGRDKVVLSASAKSLKQKWETGDLAHAEFKSEKVETSPKSLDEREEYVVSDDDEDERPRETPEPVHLSVSAKALKNKWETDDVTHAEERHSKIHLETKLIGEDYEDDSDDVTPNDDDEQPQSPEEERYLYKQDSQTENQEDYSYQGSPDGYRHDDSPEGYHHDSSPDGYHHDDSPDVYHHDSSDGFLLVDSQDGYKAEYVAEEETNEQDDGRHNHKADTQNGFNGFNNEFYKSSPESPRDDTVYYENVKDMKFSANIYEEKQDTEGNLVDDDDDSDSGIVKTANLLDF